MQTSVNEQVMGDYTNMSAWYDVIMTSGYYDYSAIVDQIQHFAPKAETVLELGAGTGLILEQLVKKKRYREVMGIDLTRSMLDIAEKRLESFDNVYLSNQNVISLTLDNSYDLSFSYGGVWYFVVGDGKEPFMVSHIPDNDDNMAGFEQISRVVNPGGTLLLGIQSPHYDYEKPISNGMKYSQKITPISIGFRKDYYLKDRGHTVMAQTLDYRTYPFSKALDMLAEFGFVYQPKKDLKKPLFMEFRKR